MMEIIGYTDRAGVRGDMVYFEAENGGAVFSISSMTWCSSAAENGYDNNVSRITENMVRKFMREEIV